MKLLKKYINSIVTGLIIFALVSPWLTKKISEHYSEKHGYDEVDKYSQYFASVSNWISGITLPILTFATVLLLFVTLWIQKDEFKNTNIAMNKQRIESNFFSLLNVFNDLKANIDHRIFNNFFNEIKQAYTFPNIQKIEDERERTAISYDHIYNKQGNKYDQELGHYFRTVHRIMKYIDDNKETLPLEERKNLVGILRAQFSQYELVCIAYNSLGEHGREKFFPLLVKYNLLDNLNEKFFIQEDHVYFFKQDGDLK